MAKAKRRKAVRVKKKVKVKAQARAKAKERLPPVEPPFPGGKIPFKIENIVASANLSLELDLYAIAREVDNVEYEPEQFPGAILKLKTPKTSLLLFKNGKLICTGAKSDTDVERAINTAFELIKKCVKRPE